MDSCSGAPLTTGSYCWACSNNFRAVAILSSGLELKLMLLVRSSPSLMRRWSRGDSPAQLVRGSMNRIGSRTDTSVTGLVIDACSPRWLMSGPPQEDYHFRSVCSEIRRKIDTLSEVSASNSHFD